MSVVGEWVRRVSYLLSRRRADEALRQEMDAHREMMPDPSRFGSTLRLREHARDIWGWRWLDDVMRDIRFAARGLRRAPMFALVAVASLALATGATTAIFSVVNSILLEPLPFPDPDRLVQVYGRSWAEDRGGPPDPLVGPVGPAELDQYIAQSTSFSGFAAYETTTQHLESATGPERLTAVAADLSFFTVLGAPAIAGRTFHEGDPPDVAVISANLWERRFQRDTTLPGKTIVLDGRPFTVLGIMDDAFQYPYGAASVMDGALRESRTDVWVPVATVLRPNPDGTPRRGRMYVVARLEAGVAIDAAGAELRTLAARLEVDRRAGNANARVGVRVVSVTDQVLGPMRRSLWMLFAAVGLVLVAACANVANLLLARTAARAREVATRAALGAGRRRLARQFLAESLLLSLVGGIIGAVIAEWGTTLIAAFAATKIPRAHEIALDWRAFGFLLSACVATAVMFGLAPAILAARVDIQRVMRESGGHATIGRGFGRVRDGLVVTEVSLAFVLALGATLVVREIVRLRHVDSGMSTRNVFVLHLTPRATSRDYYAIEQGVAQLPGVEAAGFIQLVPLQNWGWDADFSIRGRSPDPSAGRLFAGLRYVTPGYFRALSIPIVRGRAFEVSDDSSRTMVLLINEALARKYFPQEDPVGRELDRGLIVGVVGDVRNVGLDQPAQPEIYYAAAQNVTMASDIGMSLIVRTTSGATPLVGPVRSVVHEINPGLAVFDVKTMDDVLNASLWELNLYRWLIGLFAALALGLAAIGMYGVISYGVASRMREFAVRLALGSEPRRLTRLVLAGAMRLTAAGLIGGIAAALLLTPVIQHLPVAAGYDLRTFMLVAALLLGVALLACIIPAMRAARVNPAAVLRED